MGKRPRSDTKRAEGDLPARTLRSNSFPSTRPQPMNQIQPGTVERQKLEICENVKNYKSIWRSTSRDAKTAAACEKNWRLVAAKSAQSVADCKIAYQAVKKSFTLKIKKALASNPPPTTWEAVNKKVDDSKSYSAKHHLKLWKALDWLAKELTEQALMQAAAAPRIVDPAQLAETEMEPSGEKEVAGISGNGGAGTTTRRRKAGGTKKSTKPPAKKRITMIPGANDEHNRVLYLDIKEEDEDDSEYLNRGPPISADIREMPSLPSNLGSEADSGGRAKESSSGAGNELQRLLKEAEDYGMRNSLYIQLQEGVIKHLWQLPPNVFNRFLDEAKARF